MCWLTPYDWVVWGALLLVTVLLMFRAVMQWQRLIVLYVVFDILRDLALAAPAISCQGTWYAEWWWSLKYADYTLKIALLVWAAWHMLRPMRKYTLFYATTGTVVLSVLAYRSGSPFASMAHHNSVMLVLMIAANALCCFLGLYVAFLSREWPQLPTGIILGILSWSAITTILAWGQLQHPALWMTLRRLYPLAEATMLAAWWWALRTPNDGQSRYLALSPREVDR